MSVESSSPAGLMFTSRHFSLCVFLHMKQPGLNWFNGFYLIIPTWLIVRMTLLLGPPGSGKTTFLLALAGKLSSDLKVEKRFYAFTDPCLS